MNIENRDLQNEVGNKIINVMEEYHDQLIPNDGLEILIDLLMAYIETVFPKDRQDIYKEMVSIYFSQQTTH